MRGVVISLVLCTGQLEQQGNTVKSFQTVTTLSPVNILAWHPSEKNTLALTGEGRNVELWDVKGEHLLFSSLLGVM